MLILATIFIFLKKACGSNEEFRKWKRSSFYKYGYYHYYYLKLLIWNHSCLKKYCIIKYYDQQYWVFILTIAWINIFYWLCKQTKHVSRCCNTTYIHSNEQKLKYPQTNQLYQASENTLTTVSGLSSTRLVSLLHETKRHCSNHLFVNQSL